MEFFARKILKVSKSGRGEYYDMYCDDEYDDKYDEVSDFNTRGSESDYRSEEEYNDDSD